MKTLPQPKIETILTNLYPYIHPVNSTLLILGLKYNPKIHPRHVTMYESCLFRLSRQLRCNSGKPVKSRLTALTSTPRTPRGSRGQNECHISVSLLGNIYTSFLTLSVDGNISVKPTLYKKGTLS